MLACGVWRDRADSFRSLGELAATLFVGLEVGTLASHGLPLQDAEPFLEVQYVSHGKLSMSRIIDFFDRYTREFGWRVIPVYPSSKIPVGLGWNSTYNVERSRSYVHYHPNTNIGLLLGDVIDVEGDTPEANRLLESLLDGYAHPMYESSKSVHHLFRSPDDDLTALKRNGIEFRGHRHYSVIPPSVHAGGAAYTWLVEPQAAIPPMPPALEEFYNKHKRPRKTAWKKGFVEAKCGLCGLTEPIHKKRHDLEVIAFRHHGLDWECHRCRKVDVRDLCREIRKLRRR